MDYQNPLPVWMINGGAAALVLLAAVLVGFLYSDTARRRLAARLGQDMADFLRGMLGAFLVAGAGYFVAVHIGPERIIPGLETLARQRIRLPLYYVVPAATAALIVLFCALHRLEAARGGLRRIWLWGSLGVLFALLAFLCWRWHSVAAASGVVAVFGLLVALDVLERRMAGVLAMARGMLLAVLLALAVLAAGNYFDFGKWRYGTFFNAYEFYHYYIGSKYAPEVQYTGMYEATLVADQATGMKYGDAKGVRNLDTGRYYDTPEQVLSRSEEIKGWFSEARWEEFKRDIVFFKELLTKNRWEPMLRDKGYNATPIWTAVVGGGLSNNISTENWTGMSLLSLLDVILISAAALCVWWAFGFRAALLMIITLGTAYVMKYSHMKGAYLRTDFAMCIIISICLVKKSKYGAAGGFMAWSIASRIFPAAFLFGIGAKFFWALLPTLWRAPLARWRSAEKPHAPAAFWLLLFSLAAAAAAMVGAALALLVAQFLPIPLEYREVAHIGLGFAGFVLTLFFACSSLWGLYYTDRQRNYLRFFASLAITLAVLVVVSIGYAAATPPGFEAWSAKARAKGDVSRPAVLYAKYLGRYWSDYAEKIGRHNTDISPWRVGFKYLFIAQWPQKKAVWEQAADHVAAKGLRATLAEVFSTTDPVWPKVSAAIKGNKPYTRSVRWNDKTTERWGFSLFEWRWIIPLAVLGLCFLGVLGLKDYEAFAFSFVAVFFLSASTYYYFIMMLIPLLFFSPYIDRPSRALGAIAIVISGMAGYYLYGPIGWQQEFGTYYYHSLMYGLICLYMIACAYGDTLRAAWRSVVAGPSAEPRPTLELAPAGATLAAAAPPVLADGDLVPLAAEELEISPAQFDELLDEEASPAEAWSPPMQETPAETEESSDSSPAEEMPEPAQEEVLPGPETARETAAAAEDVAETLPPFSVAPLSDSSLLPPRPEPPKPSMDES